MVIWKRHRTSYIIIMLWYFHDHNVLSPIFSIYTHSMSFELNPPSTKNESKEWKSSRRRRAPVGFTFDINHWKYCLLCIINLFFSFFIFPFLTLNDLLQYIVVTATISLLRNSRRSPSSFIYLLLIIKMRFHRGCYFFIRHQWAASMSKVIEIFNLFAFWQLTTEFTGCSGSNFGFLIHFHIFIFYRMKSNKSFASS